MVNSSFCCSVSSCHIFPKNQESNSEENGISAEDIDKTSKDFDAMSVPTKVENSTDPLEKYIKGNDINIEGSEQLRKELYTHAIDTIDNRIQTQAGKIPNEVLYQYADNLFLGGQSKVTDHQNLVNQSEKCVLQVWIHRAESLAPKDVSGTSDPYCILGLASHDNFKNLKSKKQATKYVTSVKMQNLDPEWHECFELPVHRDQIDSTFLHIQVWDYDEEESMTTRIGALKDVKGMRGVGRYMKEVAQTVSKKDQDDFMGYSALPLKNIPLEGIDKWYQMRSHSALQGISGRIKVGLKLVCPHILVTDRGHPGKTNHEINGRRVENNFSDEVIYGGILLLVVNGRHNIYKDLMGEDEDSTLDGWDGKLQNIDETLLREFEVQRNVSKQIRAIAKWLMYFQEHVQLPDGIQMQCMTALLKDLEAQNDKDDSEEFRPLQPLSGRGEAATVFKFDRLSTSIDTFLRHCHNKIINHLSVYPTKQNDTIIRLGDLLICMKTVRGMKLYLTARLTDTNMIGSGDISKDIASSLHESMKRFYCDLCVELKVIGANIADLDEGNPIEEYNVPGLVKLVDSVQTALRNAQGYYDPVFKKVLKIDYMAIVLSILGCRLSEDLEGILHKVNKAISAQPDPIEEESSDNSASMFQLYLNLRDFADYMNKILGTDKIEDQNGNLSFDDVTDGSEKEVKIHVKALQGFHNWFRPTILRWLQMSRGRTIQRLTAAVQLDKVERVDDIVKHSSSAVDAIGCLSSHVVTFWLQLKWPDPMDGLVIATRMTEDISNGVELYADLVHKKLRAVGFFDDEGQFDVTEELCLALNNLEKVKLFLDSVLREMEIDRLAAIIGKMEEGPTAGKMMNSFHILVKNAESGMRKKILEVTSVVGRKMQTDVKKYLQEFASNIVKIEPKKTGAGPLNGHDSDYDLNRREWERIASGAVGPLMNYLTTNIMTLKEWLCDSNFRLVLEVLWKVCLQSFQELFLVQHKNEKPYFFKQCKYILTDHLTVFYHADGEGLELKKMFSVDEYINIDAELRMKGASSKDLMRLFFSQMYDEQEYMEDNPIYGVLNVHAYYDVTSSEVKLDVISAENLIPQDVNGFSDPFVQLTLRPKMIFPSQRTFQTLEKKKTLSPLFENESFSFQVDRENASLEGAVLSFTVLDYDIIGNNDLEGECFLLLNMLDGINNSGRKGNRNFRLPLMLPKNSKVSSKSSSPEKKADDVNGNKVQEVNTPLSHSTYNLLRERSHFDRDASEFCRWRKKLMDSVDSDDSAASSILRSLNIKQ